MQISLKLTDPGMRLVKSSLYNVGWILRAYNKPSVPVWQNDFSDNNILYLH